MKDPVKIMLISLTVLLSSCQKSNNLFLVSGYSSEGKADVMLCSFNGKGSAQMLSEVTVGNNPSFFTFGKHNLVYFANEVDSFNLSPGGGITTYSFDEESKQFARESSVNQGAAGPCHITLSNEGRYLITANYGSGSVSVVRLNHDGIPERVTDVIFYGERSHPHMTLYNPRKQIYYVSDLGLDRIHQLRLDTTIGRLMTEDVPYLKCVPGSGPRHMAIDKNNVDLFVINELNSTISVFNILSDTTDIKQTVSTLPQGYQDTSFCADLHLSANGRRLYGSNRGHNSMVTFAIGAGGRLSSPVHQSCGGNWPRNFAADPSGKYFVVANQKSNEVSVIPAGKNKSDEAGTSLQFNAPACIKFMK